MLSTVLLSPIVGIISLVMIAAVTGRKIEISRSKIVLWPRPPKR